MYNIGDRLIVNVEDNRYDIYCVIDVDQFNHTYTLECVSGSGKKGSQVVRAFHEVHDNAKLKLAPVYKEPEGEDKPVELMPDELDFQR